MNIPNSNYNPNWEIIHDYHDDHRTRLQKSIRAYHTHDLTVSKSLEIKDLEQELAFHNQACLHCLDTLQHKTVSDYYEWLLKNSVPPIDEDFLPPKEGFKSIEDIRKAWEILKDIKL